MDVLCVEKIWKQAFRDYIADFDSIAAERREDARLRKEKREREEQLMKIGASIVVLVVDVTSCSW